jgi:GGDEF domain-containing protein
LRDTDTAGRWGGEEFLAIAFDVEEAELKTLAEKLRLLVLQRKVDDFTVFFARIWVWDGLFHKHVAHILAAKPPSVV